MRSPVRARPNARVVRRPARPGERLERGRRRAPRVDARRFARVADANLLDDEDERWKRAKEDRARGVGPTDRRRMHVLALFGRARCDGAMQAAEDPRVRHPQTLERAKRTLANLHEATQEAYRGDESLCWLVHNGTVHIHAMCERLMRNGHSAHAVESLAFAVACLESHVLLAVRYLDWRVTLASEVCAAYDDVGDCDAHARAFIAKCVEHVDALSVRPLHARAPPHHRALGGAADGFRPLNVEGRGSPRRRGGRCPGGTARRRATWPSFSFLPLRLAGVVVMWSVPPGRCQPRRAPAPPSASPTQSMTAHAGSRPRPSRRRGRGR